MTIFPSIRSVSRFVSDTVDRVRTDGYSGLAWAGLRTYQRLCMDNFPQIFDYSQENVFEYDWDVLILLDACRLDLLQEVESQYDFLKQAEQDSVYSPSGFSSGWMEATITRELASSLADTIYVTGNPHTEFINATDELARLDEVWRDEWDDDLGTIPARALTDRAIWHWRNADAGRMIVHYMQPHFPSVPCPDLKSELDLDKIGSSWSGNVWDQLRQGELDQERVWDAYRQNLEYVLNDLEILLQNLDAEQVVISADHGNAIGEYGFYGHGKIPLRCVREVPWYQTSATDSKTYDPPKPNTDGESDRNIESKLQALGYMK